MNLREHKREESEGGNGVILIQYSKEKPATTSNHSLNRYKAILGFTYVGVASLILTCSTTELLNQQFSWG